MVIWISVEDIFLSKIRSANVKKVLSQKSVLTDEIDVRRLIFDSTAIFREKKNWFIQQISEFLCSCFVQFTLINVRYFKMAIFSLLFINDTFVNAAHPLNKQKCHFSLSFLCSVKFTKQ